MEFVMSQVSKHDLVETMREIDTVMLSETAIQTVYIQQDSQEKLIRSDDLILNDYDRIIEEASILLDNAGLFV